MPLVRDNLVLTDLVVPLFAAFTSPSQPPREESVLFVFGDMFRVAGFTDGWIWLEHCCGLPVVFGSHVSSASTPRTRPFVNSCSTSPSPVFAEIARRIHEEGDGVNFMLVTCSKSTNGPMCKFSPVLYRGLLVPFPYCRRMYATANTLLTRTLSEWSYFLVYIYFFLCWLPPTNPPNHPLMERSCCL